MSALESDLNRLRPLIVMQTITSRPDVSSLSKPLPPRRKRKPSGNIQPEEAINVEMSLSQSTEILADTDMNASSSRPKSYYRSGEVDEPTRKKKTRTPPPSNTLVASDPPLKFRPILADARSEMLLSAARRIGRLRTGMMAGTVRAASPEAKVEKEKEGEGRKRKSRGKGRPKSTSVSGPPISSTSRKTQSVSNLANSTPRTPHRTSKIGRAHV